MAPALIVSAFASSERLEYRNKEYGFALTFPSDWQRIADGIVQQTIETMRIQGVDTKGFSPVAGFQPKTTQYSVDYPYVLVNVYPYSRFGLGRQITENELDKLVTDLVGGDLDQILDRTLDQDLGLSSLVSKEGRAVVYADRKKHKYLAYFQFTVQGVGPVRGISSVTFGREAFVEVSIYVCEFQIVHYAPAVNEVLASFHFDADKEYDVRLASRGEGSLVWRMIMAGLFGGLIGGLIGAALTFGCSLLVEVLLGRALSAKWKTRLVLSGTIVGYVIVKTTFRGP